MKIAILVRILWTAGTQKIAIMEAKTLMEMGHDVKLYFLRGTEKGKIYLEIMKDINYEILTWENYSFFRPLYDFVTGIFMPDRIGEGRVDYNLIRKFPNHIRKENFNLLICHDQFSGLAGYYSKKKFKLNYVVYIHERLNDYPWIKGFFKRLLAITAMKYQNKILKNAHKVFGVTDKVAVSVKEYYGVNAESNLPGLSKRSIVPYDCRRKNIVLLSYWSDVKKPLSYIPFIREVDGYRFVMIGSWISSKLKEIFINEIQKNRIMEKIILLENVREEDKYDYIAKAKFFIRFGFGELGPSMGTMEAIELGTPVVVNKDIGIADIIDEKELGYIVDINKPALLIKFLKDTDVVEKFNQIQRNLEKFVEDNSWIKHCTKLLSQPI